VDLRTRVGGRGFLDAADGVARDVRVLAAEVELQWAGDLRQIRELVRDRRS